ncbi:MAG: leucyl/phenylalanyl-tRNA--protein transferase [Pseudomonadota bacterium]
MSTPQTPQRLTTDLLLKAYQIGYFPMAEDRFSRDIFWVKPDIRGVIPLNDFHISKSLKKRVRQDRYEIKVNTSFKDVIEGCALPQTHRFQTWINAPIIEAYTALFQQGHAHCVEAWENDQLVGGLYGVSIGAAFFGESMFSTATDASKVALVHLVGRLRVGGYQLLDAQFQNDHLTQFGAQEIPAGEYEIMLKDAISKSSDFYRLPAQTSGSTILQSMTHTS